MERKQKTIFRDCEFLAEKKLERGEKGRTGKKCHDEVLLLEVRLHHPNNRPGILGWERTKTTYTERHGWCWGESTTEGDKTKRYEP